MRENLTFQKQEFLDLVYLQVPKQLRRKLDKHMKQYIHVGYTYNGYRLWDPERQKNIISCDVVFDENNNHKEEILAQDKGVEENRREEQSEDEIVEHDLVNEEYDKEIVIKESQQDCERLRKRIIKQPKWLNYYETHMALSAMNYMDNMPTTYSEILNFPDKEEWLKVVDSELKSLRQNNTWTMIKKTSE